MGGWWDDFSNNLATDLGPLISLFGEAPTKQYLSETISFEEIIVFATAPLGILTTIVSVIRVCGSPSLRAFIGRAQEGEGNAEVELCSSTSKNVGELYNNGGIARIFGRPSLLEIVHDPKAAHDDFYFPPYRAEAGIHSPRDYFNRQRRKQDAHEINPQSEEPEWVEIVDRKRSITKRGKRSKRRGTDDDVEKGQEVLEKFPARSEVVQAEWDVGSDANPSPDDFAPSPNLSLNVGIKQRPRYWFVMAAILGIILQAAVLVWAAFARYGLGLSQNGVTDRYAVPMTTLGTIFVCFGVGFCAYLIEKSTQERRFERKTTDIRQHRSKVYWIQPGGQKLGDQVFDSFAYTHDKLSSYVTSWKANGNLVHEQNRKKRKLLHDQVLVWAAVLITFVGFGLQFLGLRACHSSVSVCQLGVMLVMSFVRAVLRTERLAKEDNMMNDHPDSSQGHELDWLAFRLNDDADVKQQLQITSSGYNEPDDMELEREYEKHFFLKAKDEYQVVAFGPLNRYSIPELPEFFNRCRKWLQKAQGKNEAEPNATAKLVLFRNRLAHLTKSWAEEQVAVRAVARNLAKAIEDTTHILLTAGLHLEAYEDLPETSMIYWPVECVLSKESQPRAKLEQVFLSVRRCAEYNDEELGSQGPANGRSLWVTGKSGQHSPRTSRKKSQNDQILTSRILWESADENPEGERDEFESWCDKTSYYHVERAEARHTWFQTGVHGHINAQLPSATLELGWQNVSKASTKKRKVNSWKYLKRTSISTAFAQEVYSSFFTAIAHLIKDIGGESKSGHPYLENTTISRIQQIFVENELGSSNDALACILPALKIQGKLPSRLHVAAVSGDMQHVKYLIETCKVDPNCKDIHGETHLTAAVKAGVPAMVDYLRLLGSDPNISNTEGRTPLLLALSQNADLTVRNLFESHWNGKEISLMPDANLADGSGVTPLVEAVNQRNVEIATLLLEKGASPDLGTTLASGLIRTPLSSAIQNGQKEMVQLLIAHQADVNSSAFYGQSLLHLAAAKPLSRTDDAHCFLFNQRPMPPSKYELATRSETDIVEELLDADVNPDARYMVGGETALHTAASNAQPWIMKRLLYRGASANAQDDAGRTPLHVAACHHFISGDQEPPSVVNTMEWDVDQSIEYTTEDVEANAVNLLIECGADPTIRDNAGRTPLDALNQAVVGG
ncbi:hypothetical protein IWZ01DRAFT_524523 [Phyllosticta capitalensis]